MLQVPLINRLRLCLSEDHFVFPGPDDPKRITLAINNGLFVPLSDWTTAQDPGHKHSKLWASDGSFEAVTVNTSGVGVKTSNPLGVLQIGSSTQSRIIFNDGWLQEFATTSGSGISSNMYYSSGYKYRTSNPAVHLDISGGKYSFYTCPTGTADNPAPHSLRLIISNDGKIGLGTSSPVISGTGKLHLAGDTMRLDTSRTPANAGDTGNTGEFCWDSNYIYLCVATNAWRRAPHSTW